MMNIISQEEINTIHDLCDQYNIENYTINSDGSIDVDGAVNLLIKGLTILPLLFNVVSGDFGCSFNQLTSLEHCPKEIGGDFDCYINNLPDHFNELYNELKSEEIKIFIKYQHDMGIWSDGYDQEAAQLLYEEIKDGLL